MGSILGSSDNPQLKASEPQVRGAHQGGECHTDRQTDRQTDRETGEKAEKERHDLKFMG